MQYMGGKSAISREIGEYINRTRERLEMERGEPVPYWEPFVGAGWIHARIIGAPNYASDIHDELIELWKALQRGWIPPTSVSKARYNWLKSGNGELYERAFVGFASSFGGRYYKAYAGGGERNYAKQGAESILYKAGKINNTVFYTADFITAAPPAPACLIYCDPPYEGTEPYLNTPPFDTKAYWERVAELENRGHVIITSEYNAPDGYTTVWERKVTASVGAGVHGSAVSRVERLFVRNPRIMQYQPSLYKNARDHA